MNKIRTAFVLAASLALTGVAFAQAKVVPAQSQITFAIKEMGVPVEGKFAQVDGRHRVRSEEARGRQGRLHDRHRRARRSARPRPTPRCPRPNGSTSPSSPTRRFASTAIKAKGGGKFDVAGKLTVKGTTKDVVVPIALTQAGPTTTATGTFTIKRNDFKIGEGEWTDTSQLADDVAVKFKIALTGVAPL